MFFTGYTFANVAIALVCLVSLVAVNELSRRSKKLSIALYIVLPIALAIFVWPETAVKGDGDWFPIVKTCSALVGVIAFMAIRYIPNLLEKAKWMLVFPFAILAINIVEAIIRDIEVFSTYKTLTYDSVQGLWFVGGAWNIMNAIAGVILIVTLTGLVGIKVANTKTKDMVWGDMLWFWIIAYDLWNMAYCYNCISTRSMYAGLILLISCTVCEFFFKRGAWLQHRAQTLALWGMFSVTFSDYASSPLFSITSTNNTTPLFILSFLALTANLAVLVFEIYTIKKTKRNPLKEDLYQDLKAYKLNMQENGL